MRKRARIESVGQGRALLVISRESACSGDCHRCPGCGAVKQELRVQADNPIGAGRGDEVIVESCTSTVLWAAVLVYLLPLAGFLAGYLIAGLRGLTAWLSLAGFVLGWLPALLYNRRVRRRPPRYTVVAYATEERE